ncbi:MAG TPA: TlpA disulfide reductase family protein [Bacteroidales bacterium]|nr:TlpA disulfide reductase family protein [Bacteroidales bacterium]HRW97186.1 TlpA disulfide reductase family protein [Bacteroidales bacterium]
MKNILVLLFLTGSTTFLMSQNETKTLFKLPEVTIQSIDGKSFNTKNIENEGKPVILTFWATWCKPCLREHDAISEYYAEWAEETGVKVYAISIDDARSSRRVMPTVNGKGWEFEVLLDPNGEFKRLMNVNIPPHVFVLNEKREVVWQHIGYLDGDEMKYIEVVEKVLAGENIN